MAAEDKTTIQQLDTRNKNKVIWYNVMRDDELFRALVGSNSSSSDDNEEEDMVSISHSMLYPKQNTNDNDNIEQNGEEKMIKVQPLRTLTSKLPFAIRFMLELHLFDNNIIKTQVVSAPPPPSSSNNERSDELTDINEQAKLDDIKHQEELDILKEQLGMVARRMVVTFIQYVIPPLLEMDWNELEYANNFTLSELFAEAIGTQVGEGMSILSKVKQDVKDEKIDLMNGSLFTREDINNALDQARDWLRIATERCRASEQDLNGDEDEWRTTDIDTIKQRSKWPYAEYSVKFLVNGELVPADYEMIKNTGQHQQQDSSSSSSSLGLCNSRRGLRESGWLVRDRFCRITNAFDVCEDLVDWIRNKPVLCGRQYQLLFDKGVGTDMKVWLFSNSPVITRDEFLTSIGDFKNVLPSKVGDRISLAFTQTAPIMSLSYDQIIAIPERVRNGYAFSDGNGIMGIGIARKIQEVMGLNNLPGAVQIRMSGLKGMLSLNLKFESNAIGIRPSQMKFLSNHHVLEVKSTAQARLGDCKLFKESLLVMDNLGLYPSTFYNLQIQASSQMLLKYDDVNGTLDNVEDNKEYLRNALKDGKKRNSGQNFTKEELEIIRGVMDESREKVNLPCKEVAVMFGIVDEYDMLGEDEVLVCNGKISGEVLVLRAPCNFPGDIQKATAVKGKPDKAYTCLDQVLVFSAKGARPLPDKLGGGDLDGDRYFVIYNEHLAAVTPKPPHDFGTQNTGIQVDADISQALSPLSDSFSPPRIEDQLDVLRQFMVHGNLVSSTADAFLRVADMNGVAHENAQKLAELHQRALDSRKTYDNIDKAQLAFMNDVLNFPRPHYKGGSRKGTSILGVIYDMWKQDIKAIDKRIDNSSNSKFELDTTNDNELLGLDKVIKKLDWEKKKRGKVCLFQSCVACGTTNAIGNMKQCAVCGAVFICSRRCESLHWKMCFSIQWTNEEEYDDYEDDESIVSSSTLQSSSFDESKEITAETISMSSSFVSNNTGITDITLTKDYQDIIEDLIEIVFGTSDKPTLDGLHTPGWSSLCTDDLPTLRKMSLVEFYSTFKKEYSSAITKDVIDSLPHIYDVYLMEQRLKSGNIRLAVWLRNESIGGQFMWRGEDDVWYPTNPPFHQHRVASLSGTCRIQESLHAKPTENTLMAHALTRNVHTFATVEEMYEDGIHQMSSSLIAELNVSQAKAVATVCNPSFNAGFLFIHGPPGTGKTRTLAAMVDSLLGGLVVAPSNAAVSNVAVKILSSTQLEYNEVVVYGENCDRSIHFLNPTHRSRYYQKLQKEYLQKVGTVERKALLQQFTEWLSLDKRVYLDSEEDMKRLLLLGFAKWLRFPLSGTESTKVIEAHIVNYCAKVGISKVDDSKKGERVLGSILAKAKVVLCTLNTAGSSFLRNALNGKHHTLFLDEAAQVPEAEFYIATTFPGIRRIVNIGDPRQLNSTVVDRDVEAMGYGDSFMSHVMNSHPGKAHMLNTQYRCNPKILEFSNKSFYYNKIKTATSLSNRTEVGNPIQFVDINGEEDYEGQSSMNRDEATEVLFLLKEDKDIKKLKQVGKMTIMIITPYRAQVSLIRRKLKTENLINNIKVDTVDAFQGQEADVVILSLVRTYQAGFVDDPRRINVALTRARILVRVIGSLKFWDNQSNESTLKQLVSHCKAKGFVHSKMKKKAMQSLMQPNWSLPRLFQINITSRFHHCLRRLTRIDEKNLAFNTLIRLAQPSLNDLEMPPRKDSIPSWQMSSLKHQHIWVVWIAKEEMILEGHFVGSRDECLHFQQDNPVLPSGSVCVKDDMSGIILADSNNGLSQNIIPSWLLTKRIGEATLDGVMDELPKECFDLDKEQKDTINRPVPIMLESGAGTGKTNVLFQHATNKNVYKTRSDSQGTVLFVTRSPLLRKGLSERYKNNPELDRDALPRLLFFSSWELMENLAEYAGLALDNSSLCTFVEYINSRKSHSAIGDAMEAENEICGVIIGSLTAAKVGRHLTRDEYISERSYIRKDLEAGIKKRHEVYSIFEKYKRWKLENKKVDLGDVVLKLITHKRLRDSSGRFIQLFTAVYLDEIQDFTYALIYLITNIAGYSSLHWVFAGDTAQMISPGCSFTFQGLKDVLLVVKPGIESDIKTICNLGRNYRVTKDVLVMSNALLRFAKQYFKNDIQYFRPEIPMNDHGTRVRLCRWKEAIDLEGPRLSPKQALILSSSNSDTEEDLTSKMRDWLGPNSFVLTSLESKGLEFDDIIVAFQMHRKTWNVASGHASSLRLVRELNVAVTRKVIIFECFIWPSCIVI